MIIRATCCNLRQEPIDGRSPRQRTLRRSIWALWEHGMGVCQNTPYVVLHIGSSFTRVWLFIVIYRTHTPDSHPDAATQFMQREYWHTPIAICYPSLPGHRPGDVPWPGSADARVPALDVTRRLDVCDQPGPASSDASRTCTSAVVVWGACWRSSSGDVAHFRLEAEMSITAASHDHGERQ